MTVPISPSQSLYDKVRVGQSIWKKNYGFGYAVVTAIDRRPDVLNIFYKRHNGTTDFRKMRQYRLMTKVMDGILMIGDTGWQPYIVISEIEESCLTCVSKCKKNEMCTFYQPLRGIEND